MIGDKELVISPTCISNTHVPF